MGMDELPDAACKDRMDEEVNDLVESLAIEQYLCLLEEGCITSPAPAAFNAVGVIDSLDVDDLPTAYVDSCLSGVFLFALRLRRASLCDMSVLADLEYDACSAPLDVNNCRSRCARHFPKVLTFFNAAERADATSAAAAAALNDDVPCSSIGHSWIMLQ